MSDEANQTQPPATQQPPAQAQPPAQRQPSLFAQPPAAVPLDVLQRLAAAELRAKQADALEAELAAKRAAEDETKGLVAQLNEKVALTEKAKAELAAQRRADAIKSAALTAAIKHGAVNEHQLVKLVLDELDADDAGNVVHRADPKVSADAFVAKYLADNAHLARPKTAKGSGASPFPAAAPSTGGPPTFDLTTAEGLTQYARWLTYAPGKAPAPAGK